VKRTALFVALTTLVASNAALAVGTLAQVTIIDRSTGTELVPHLFHGEYWIAGTPGARYAIEIRNTAGERLLTVASVDGVNVVTGATAGWSQTGYVFDSGQGYEITGWRKSDDEVAAFTFTDSSSSYAERTGRPANVGIIGVAVFLERLPRQVYEPPRMINEPAPVPSPAPSPAPSAGAPSPAPFADSAARSSAPAQPSSSTHIQAEAATKLGTGHGEREFSHAGHTEFVRRQPEPNELIRIRYDSLENLIAMGIVAPPHFKAPTANPFPSSREPQYVPDPPGS
jgi:hypothetical protein